MYSIKVSQKKIQINQVTSSSNVTGYGYDCKTKTLFVTFKGNSTYQYFQVPNLIWKEIKKADSKGKYLHTFVKKPGFSYQKVN